MTKISFKSIWEDCEKKNNYPSRANNIKVVDYKDFEKNVTEEKESFVLDIVNSLYSGDIYILKGAYTKEFMNSLRVRTFDYFKDKPSEFHKMLEGCPDFHRKIDFFPIKSISLVIKRKRFIVVIYIFISLAKSKC